MRNQFDVQANDLQAADLECVVSMNAHQFASKHPRYSRRGKMGIAMLRLRARAICPSYRFPLRGVERYVSGRRR